MKRIVYYIIFLISLCTLTSCFKSLYSFQEGIYEFDKETYRKSIDSEYMEEFIGGYEVETFSMIFKKITKEEFIEKEEKYDVLEDMRNREYYHVEFIISFKDLNEKIETSFETIFRYEAGRAYKLELNLRSSQFNIEKLKLHLMVSADYSSNDLKVDEISITSSENRNELRHNFSISLYYIDEETIENEGE